jgi:hypothetical protein
MGSDPLFAYLPHRACRFARLRPEFSVFVDIFDFLAWRPTSAE